MTPTTDQTYTISPDDAAGLAYANDGAMAGDWCREADYQADTGRWLEYRTLVLRHDDGTVWGLDYARGLTEEQEGEYPWRDEDGPLPLRRLHRHETITVQYETTPPADPDAPQVLVDRVYDVMYAALGEHDLISCPVTETYPAAGGGIESGHVLDIAEQVVKALRALEPARDARIAADALRKAAEALDGEAARWLHECADDLLSEGTQ